MAADPKSWFPNLPWLESRKPASAPVVLKKKRTPAARPVPPPPAVPGPMDAMRDGDRFKKLGLVRQAIAAYRAAIEKFLAEGKTAHARSACKVALELAPDDRDLVAILAEIADAKSGTPAPKPFARIALVKQVVPVEAPVLAPTPRPPTEDEKKLGLIPLEHGEELMGEDAFDPATGSLSMPPPPRLEDEEMYLDLAPVILEQERDEPTLVPHSGEPVAFFEDPDSSDADEKPTKVVR